MKVIFLDIDGVLQPYNSEKRFKIDRKELRKKLSEEFDTDYTIYNEYDVAACYADWDKDAVEKMKKTIEYIESMQNSFYSYRIVEILEYVYNNPEITNYVAIDDLNLEIGLEGHFVKTYNLINDEQADKCIKILNNNNQ